MAVGPPVPVGGGGRLVAGHRVAGHVTMRSRRLQGYPAARVKALAALLLVALLTPPATPTGARAEEPAVASTGGDDARRAALRAAAQELIDPAVRRRYGWGWIREHRPAEVPLGVELVSMEPGASPAAGLALYYAAQALGDPPDGPVRAAAWEAARGVLSSIDHDGRIHAGTLFAHRAGQRFEQQAVPDTGPTRAGLGLVLALIDDGAFPAHDVRLRRGAGRMARWLREMQGNNGSWMVETPPEAPSGAPARMVRLDTTAGRDAAIAMLFAGDVIDEHWLNFASQKTVDFLIGLRLTDADRRYRGLWGTIYGAGGGMPVTSVMRESADVDLLATRHAMEVLLVSHLLRGDAASLAALDEAVAQLHRLRQADGTWRRMPAIDPPAAVDPMIRREDHPLFQTVDMTPLIEAVGQVHRLGREEAADVLFGPLPLRQRLAVVLTGLESSLLPTGANGADADAGEDDEMGEDLLGSRARLVWRLVERAEGAGFE